MQLVLHYLSMQEQREKEHYVQQQKALQYRGVANGFACLSALGEATHNQTLSQLALVGGQGFQIHMAVQQMAGLEGAALLNPISAIVMAGLSLSSLFMKKGPSSDEIILRQLQQITWQIQSLQRDLQEKFSAVHDHLSVMQRRLLFVMQQLEYLLAKPVMRRLDDIQYDLKSLSDRMKAGFQDLLLQDLQKQLMLVDRLLQGVVPVDMMEKTQLLDVVINLSAWLTEKSYNRHFNGLLLVSPKQSMAELPATTRLDFFQQLYQQRNLSSALAPMMLMACQEGWLTGVNPEIAHSGIYLQAMQAYLTMRELIATKTDLPYDPDSKELTMFIDKTQQQLHAMSRFSDDPAVMQGLQHKMSQSLQAAHDSYQQSQQQFAAILKPWQMSADAVHDPQALPQQFTFHYAPGGDADKRRGRMRDFTAANGFTQQDCLALVAKKAAEANVALFDPVLLQAEQCGLIEFRCKMHRTMSNGGKQRYRTEGERYGLDMILVLKETGENFTLTSATPGWAKWDNAHDHTAQVTINSHRREIPQKTRIHDKAVLAATAKITQVMQARLHEEKRPLYQQISESCLQKDSAVQQLLMLLQYAKLYGFFAKQHVSPAWIERAEASIKCLLTACKNASETANQNIIDEQLQQQLPALLESLALAIEVNAESLSAASPLQDFTGALQALVAYRDQLEWHAHEVVVVSASVVEETRIGATAPGFFSGTSLGGGGQQGGVGHSFNPH